MSKLSKQISLVMMIVLITLSFAACKATDKNSVDNDVYKKDVTIKVATLKGPTGMGMAKLMEDVNSGNSAVKSEYIISTIVNMTSIVYLILFLPLLLDNAIPCIAISMPANGRTCLIVIILKISSVNKKHKITRYNPIMICLFSIFSLEKT